MVPQHHAPDLFDHAAMLLREFYQRSQRLIDRRMSAKGASFARARILLRIAVQGPLRSIDLASAFNYAPRTVTESVDGLERDHLVRRDPDPADRRAKRISLTPEGKRAADGAERARRAYVASVFGALTDDENRELARLLVKLNARLEEMEDE